MGTTRTDLIPRPSWATTSDQGEGYVRHAHTVTETTAPQRSGARVELERFAGVDEEGVHDDGTSLVVHLDRTDPTFTDPDAVEALGLALIRGAVALRLALAADQ